MLRRQALLVRAGAEPLTERDRARLQVRSMAFCTKEIIRRSGAILLTWLVLMCMAHQMWELLPCCFQEFGLRECALGGGGGHSRVPAWLEKWTALILEFVQEEQRLLPEQLLALPSNIVAYTPFTAASEAKGEPGCSQHACTSSGFFPVANYKTTKSITISKRDVGWTSGVSDNRLQNVVITLDKVKLCLSKPGQCLNAPLRLLTDSEVAEYLWTGVLTRITCVWP